VIARAGVPVVRLVPVQRLTERKLGQWEGLVKFAEDFNEPLPPEELAAWEGQ
jgi:antitoxin (DNA-binding transcriptional repressor) of toxin-antitoxin stability system